MGSARLASRRPGSPLSRRRGGAPGQCVAAAGPGGDARPALTCKPQEPSLLLRCVGAGPGGEWTRRGMHTNGTTQRGRRPRAATPWQHVGVFARHAAAGPGSAGRRPSIARPPEPPSTNPTAIRPQIAHHGRRFQPRAPRQARTCSRAPWGADRAPGGLKRPHLLNQPAIGVGRPLRGPQALRRPAAAASLAAWPSLRRLAAQFRLPPFLFAGCSSPR